MMRWLWFGKPETYLLPLHLRNAPTKLMKQLGYGDNYKYAHDYENHFVKQQFLPDEIKSKRIWKPQLNAAEQKQYRMDETVMGREVYEITIKTNRNEDCSIRWLCHQPR